MEQKIYPFEEHRLPLESIDPDALYVMEKLRNAGFVAYLVGGSVRDLLLGHTPKDFDISTSAEPEQIRCLFRSCILIGRRFRLAHIRFGRKIIEVATFRSGNVESDTLILRDNEWGTPEEDVLRRDFTINGLFYEPESQTIIDYVSGYPDLQKRYLRTIGQPFLRFKQDPVRMLRLLKFQARFGFEIDPDSHIALLECRSENIKSSPARVLEEILRMLESGFSATFMRLIAEHGLLPLLLPALSQFLETEKGEEIGNYLQEVDTTFNASSLSRSILLSCIAFPMMEKRIQTHYVDRERLPHLGEIQNEAYSMVHDLFHPFFLIPRRMKFEIVSILTSQYRLTPLEKKRLFRKRIPRDADFPLALQFFQIRAQLEPALQTLFEEWSQIYKAVSAHPEKQPPLRRRRRRKRTT